MISEVLYLPLIIFRWFPKSQTGMRATDSHSDCIILVGVSRPKIAALFLFVMLISLFLTFHILYDSAIYSIQAATTISDNKLSILTSRVPNSEITHSAVFSHRIHFPKTSRKLPQVKKYIFHGFFCRYFSFSDIHSFQLPSMRRGNKWPCPI